MEHINEFLIRRQETLDRGILNWGDTGPLKALFQKGAEGKPLTIGFIGGSITQGCAATTEAGQYTHLIHQWFCDTFPQAEITYQNAPVGGTDSQFGVARVEEDLLVHNPDLVVIEFSVNDQNTPFYQETYEGLVRKVLSWPKTPAVVLLMNTMYNGQGSAQDQHLPVGRAYDLPCLSMKESFLEEVEAGHLSSRQLTVDDLHPNDLGHQQVADLVINFFDQLLVKRTYLPKPLTKNRFQGSVRYQNSNSSPILCGFQADTTSKASSWYYFANGWTAGHVGDSITFQVSGSSIAVQYKKCASHPAPVAVAYVDGEENPIVLDANFDQDWGDCLYLQMLAMDLEDREHTVTVRVTETHPEDTAEFYLVSVIAGR